MRCTPSQVIFRSCRDMNFEFRQVSSSCLGYLVIGAMGLIMAGWYSLGVLVPYTLSLHMCYFFGQESNAVSFVWLIHAHLGCLSGSIPEPAMSTVIAVFASVVESPFLSFRYSGHPSLPSSPPRNRLAKALLTSTQGVFFYMRPKRGQKYYKRFLD